MIITPESIDRLFTGYSAAYQRGMNNAPPDEWDKIATLVPSTSKSNTYGWLGQFPRMNEWIGSRSYQNMQASSYVLVNRKFESTVEVPADDITDDAVGIYAPMFEELGRAAKSHPDELVFELLGRGTSAACYDGQYFFDTDHPVAPNTDGTGTAVSVSNYQEGTGPEWYLFDTSRALKPLIFQKRKDYRLIRKDNPQTSDRTFDTDTFVYGVDCRVEAGFGFWQMAYCSKAPLNADNYAAARAAMQSFKADGGRPLGIRPNLLVVPAALEQPARRLLVKDEAGGNEWAGSAEVLCSRWLS